MKISEAQYHSMPPELKALFSLADNPEKEEVTGGFPYTVSGEKKVSAARFFYCAKSHKSERNACYNGDSVDNKHPTVKPLKLLRYLIQLITPQGGITLDPFAGSGSTGLAARQLGFDFVLIEKELESVNIAKQRVNDAQPLEGYLL
jgi:DNA modification methylase